MQLMDSDYQRFYQWWQYLHDKYDEEAINRPSNRAARAHLRRCKNVVQISFEQTYVHLQQAFPDIPMECIAVIAGVLAHCKDIKLMPSNPQDYFAKQMAGFERDTIPVKPLRFRRLLATKTLAELYPQLLRIIAIIREPIDLRSLVYGICHWNDEQKQVWAYAYYAVLPTDKE